MSAAAVKAAVLITGDTNVRGSLRFVQLPDGRRGFHIHALGDTTNGCNSTDLQHHAGDLGNIIATLNGVAEISIVVNQIPLTGRHSILGRAVVVYADPDDLGKDRHELCKTAGNAGAGIGCGIIKLKSSV